MLRAKCWCLNSDSIGKFSRSDRQPKSEPFLLCSWFCLTFVKFPFDKTQSSAIYFLPLYLGRKLFFFTFRIHTSLMWFIKDASSRGQQWNSVLLIFRQNQSDFFVLRKKKEKLVCNYSRGTSVAVKHEMLTKDALCLWSASSCLR